MEVRTSAADSPASREHEARRPNAITFRPVPSTAHDLIKHRTPEFRRTNLALFWAGFATFALLYSVQPLMPVFARDFHVSATQASLSLSLTTGLLAPAMIVAGAISESRGRKPIMVVSLVSSSLLTFACAFASQWHAFLAIRALAGIAFAGLPAISMAYVAEEMHPTSMGLAMGLAISGNGLGGMAGRLASSYIADAFSWRWAMAGVGLLGLAAAAIFWRTLPPSRHFVPREPRVRALLGTFRSQLADGRLVPLFALGFLLMGAFVTTYNYVAYHLLERPYLLSQAAAGSVFVVYPVGIFSSAYIGSRADHVGRGRMLRLMALVMLIGVALMAMRPLAMVILGVATVTAGFFGGHSVASSWVGLRAATNAKAQASALYLFFYYIGASIVGSLGGTVWDRWRWPGVEFFVAALLVVALFMTIVLTGARPPNQRLS
jgi:YNFM family putative membrane transporter